MIYNSTLEPWATPDFIERETAMEVTAYAALLEDEPEGQSAR